MLKGWEAKWKDVDDFNLQQKTLQNLMQTQLRQKESELVASTRLTEK